LAKILVDIARIYGSPLAGLVDVSKEGIARDIAACFDHPRELGVGKVQRVFFCDLPANGKTAFEPFTRT